MADLSQAADSVRVDAFWKLVRTEQLPELGQGPRAGVMALAELEPRLRAYCRSQGVGPDRCDLLVATGLLYHDHQNESHDLVQDMTDVDGGLIHAILHRREPDYWNAKYWFRRVGDHPVYRGLAARVAAAAESEPARDILRRLTLSGTVDPLGIVDACEAVARRPGTDPAVEFLRRLQHAEFEGLVGHLLAAG
ncbi:MAG: hypothetical protein DVB31_12240 [Verrucomicrobia bacterium]|nr:MAG: hypothetical protein DVB31_12240 [Verrucomicrobiota bacterium]